MEKDGTRHDLRPFILAVPMVVIFIVLILTPADQALRYIMPVLAAQPMFWGSCIKGIGKYF